MPTPAECAAMPVHITRDGDIYIGDHQIPGCIAENGITIKPGAPNHHNQLTIDFIVGPIHADDPSTPQPDDNPYTYRPNQVTVRNRRFSVQ